MKIGQTERVKRGSLAPGSNADLLPSEYVFKCVKVCEREKSSEMSDRPLAGQAKTGFCF